MAGATSPATGRCYAVARVCRIWEVPRLRWSPEFGQVVKLGLFLRRTNLHDGQEEAVFR